MIKISGTTELLELNKERRKNCNETKTS